MEFIVLSRYEATKFESDVPWGVISIAADPNNFPILSGPNRVGLLQIAFADAIKPNLAYPLLKLFSVEDAEKILDFVDGLQVNLCMVHCAKGESRSPAVAMALSEIYNEAWTVASWQRPNPLVYEILKAVASKR